jgi:hypothetical protein
MSNSQRKLFASKPSNYFLSAAFAICLQLIANSFISAQDNSPYSRYGLGDLHPNTNIYNRGMGGLSAGFSDQPIDGLSDPRTGKYYPSINFLNPASYSRFYAIKEPNSKKLVYGRMLLDIGINFNTRTLKEANTTQSFSSTNGYFSYLQVGVPIRKNWGLVFGLRPLSTISYKITRNERLPNIDSVQTLFTGDGGSYLFNLGTGVAIKNFSIGVNAGYLFGKKDFSTRRYFLNDSVIYSASNHQTKTNFGGLFFNAGVQYRLDLNKDKTKYIQWGAFGNVQHRIDSKSNLIRETYFVDASDGSELRLDSVYEQTGIKGNLDYPSSFGIGFIVEQLPDVKKNGWLFGLDLLSSNWDNYRFNGQTDAVKTNWQFRFGGQLRPRMKETYKSLPAYRVGMFIGDDYVYLGSNKLPTWGLSAGISLPIANLKDAARRFRTQYSIVNLSAEYIKRGNNTNPINENLFRISAGFTLSDLWFTKRKYD